MYPEKSLNNVILAAHFRKNPTEAVLLEPLYLPEIVEFSTLFIFTAFLPKNCHKTYTTEIQVRLSVIFTVTLLIKYLFILLFLNFYRNLTHAPSARIVGIHSTGKLSIFLEGTELTGANGGRKLL